jgi:hypothetical protein
MKAILVLCIVPFLVACETIKLPDKGVGCTKLVRPWGSIIITAAAGEKNDKSQPDVTVDDNCKMTVTNHPAAK